MNNAPSTEKQMARAVLLLLAGVMLFFLAWVSLAEPAFKPIFEAAIGKEVFELPWFAEFMYFLAFGLLPPLAVGAGSYAFAYYKWFIPNRTKLANEQLQKLSEARKAMAKAVTYIEVFEQELREKSSEAERMREEVLSLKLLNSEHAAELERKLKAMESLTRNRIWFERTFAFVIGILSSLAASYLWQAFQHG